MPATKSDLDLALEHLRLDVANVNVLRKMTRAQERRVMGDVFVWWQRAREVKRLRICQSCNKLHKCKLLAQVAMAQPYLNRTQSASMHSQC